MTRPLFVLRPEPGNAATSAVAKAHGLTVHSHPLFETMSVDWDAPDPARYVGVIMTSANAARLAGPQLQRFVHLPLYAVGEVTAEAARVAGFTSIVAGDGDVERLLGRIATLGLHRLLHLSGADIHPFEPHGVEMDRCVVYASLPLSPAPGLLDAIEDGGVAMLHSPRAAKQFAAVIDAHGFDRSSLAIAAISKRTAESAGSGWQQVSVATLPRDHALLECALALCQTGG